VIYPSHGTYSIHAEDGRQHPVYVAIKASSLVDCVRVIMETPGIQESWR
jgi:hypothetical protein